jgi:S-DNA-T family DNA segregation ATPase FtsK/SpoIIIE
VNTTLVRRPPRRPAPGFPHGDFPLQEPPSLPEPQGGQISTMLMYLPMAAASGVMMLMFITPGRTGRIIGYLGSGMMVIAMGAMAFAQLARVAGDRKLKLKGERRDYLRYLGQVRRKVRKAIDSQRRSMLWIHPDPQRLWAIANSDRLWERRATHADFCEVRIGLGPQQLALRLQAPQTKPVEDLEPLCASALRRFLRAHGTVEDLPMAIYLRSFARVQLRDLPGEAVEHPAGPAGPGEGTDRARAMARALVTQLATFHSPDDVRLVVCASPERLADWDWVKWLPHALHPSEHDAAGPVRMVAETWGQVESLLGEAFAERSRFDPRAAPSANEPYVVIVLDGVEQPERSRPATVGYRNTTVVDVGGNLPWKDHRLALRLRAGERALEMVEVDRAGTEQSRRIGRPDALSLGRCETFARRMAPFRSGRASEGDPTSSDVELTTLLGAGVGLPARPHRRDRSRCAGGARHQGVGAGRHGAARHPHRRHRLRQE